MAEDTKITPQLSGLDPSLTGIAPTKKKNNEEIGKNEFLSLLVTQLKNQDPLDPMKSEEFAVNLAQFSQLEQLVSINEKIGGGAGGSEMSLASYLGHEVFMESETVRVDGSDGGALKVSLPRGGAVSVELLDSAGRVAETIDAGTLEPGEQTIRLRDLSAASGDYGYRVKVMPPSGAPAEVPALVGGMVTGFVPGPSPMLIVGGREVAAADVREVRMAPSLV